MNKIGCLPISMVANELMNSCDKSSSLELDLSVSCDSSSMRCIHLSTDKIRKYGVGHGHYLEYFCQC